MLDIGEIVRQTGAGSTSLVRVTLPVLLIDLGLRRWHYRALGLNARVQRHQVLDVGQFLAVHFGTHFS